MNNLERLNSYINLYGHYPPKNLKMKYYRLNVGVADADLIESVNERFPNTCSMRISGYHKGLGDSVKLIRQWDEVKGFDLVYVSKVFTDTNVPEWVTSLHNVIWGGTGFYYPNEAPPLPSEIHHHFPDYHLYDEWVGEQLAAGKDKEDLRFYIHASIGKLTEGCFMKCDFCVNRLKDKVVFNAKLSEFYDPNRKIIILLDDQFLGYAGWEHLIDELNATGKPFQFKQGLDIRVLDDKRAAKLANSNYYEDFIFAFDKAKQTKLIQSKLELWRKYTDKRTKLYVFCGYDKRFSDEQSYPEEFWVQDIENMFKRIFVLAEYDCTAYIMRHKDYKLSPWKTIYSEAASWTAQQWALRTLNYRTYCIRRGMGRLDSQYRNDPKKFLEDGHKKYAAWRVMEEFEAKYPEVASKWFGLIYKEFIKEPLSA